MRNTSLYRFLRNLKAGTEAETLGRHIVSSWANEVCNDLYAPVVVDVGAGYGEDLLAIAGRHPNADLNAIESFPNAQEQLREVNIKVSEIDLERGGLPFAESSVDLIICNQVFEHLKEIFWLTSELQRVLRTGGVAIVGVPNLASLHNRVSLLLGQQPPAIHVLGPHVRGFTISGLKEMLEWGESFKVEKVAGGNSYPLPQRAARAVARIFPNLAVSIFLFARRQPGGAPYMDLFTSRRGAEMVDTPYFRGPARPNAPPFGVSQGSSVGGNS